MNSLKLKSYTGDNVTCLCAEVLVDAEIIDSSRDFNPDHLGYIIRIFEDASDPRLYIWEINNYK